MRKFRCLYKKSFEAYSTELENKLYIISIVCIVISAMLYFLIDSVLYIFGLEYARGCLLQNFFGIPCLGCGGTRAVINLLSGRIMTAIYYNAFVVYCFIIYLCFFISFTFKKIMKKEYTFFHLRHCYLILAVIILLIQYIIKLIIPSYLL